MDDERARRWCEWMAAAQAGDSVSYEKLLVEMLPVVRGFVLRRLRDPVVTEDVVQNVFVSIHRFRHSSVQAPKSEDVDRELSQQVLVLIREYAS